MIMDNQGEVRDGMRIDWDVPITMEDGLVLVSKRAMAMQKACEKTPSTMAAIIGLDDKIVEDVCSSVNEVVVPANYNSPGQIVISGHSKAVERAIGAVKQRGKKAVLLPVSAPFHCALLKPAAERLKEELAKVEVGDLRIPVLSNAEADFYPGKNKIGELLFKQITHPVRWEECMGQLIRTGVNLVLEVGPGKVLTGLMRRISKDLKMANVEDGPSWGKAQALLAEN